MTVVCLQWESPPPRLQRSSPLISEVTLFLSHSTTFSRRFLPSVWSPALSTRLTVRDGVFWKEILLGGKNCTKFLFQMTHNLEEVGFLSSSFLFLSFYPFILSFWRTWGRPITHPSLAQSATRVNFQLGTGQILQLQWNCILWLLNLLQGGFDDPISNIYWKPCRTNDSGTWNIQKMLQRFYQKSCSRMQAINTRLSQVPTRSVLGKVNACIAML